MADEKKSKYQYFVKDRSIINSFADISDYPTLSQKLPQNITSELAPLFIKESELLIKNIKEAHRNKNIQQLHFAIHALKGTCGNMGVERLYQICSYINSSTKESKWSKEENWIKQIEGEFKNIKLELKEFVK